MTKRQIASTGQIVDDGEPAKPEPEATSITIKIYSPFKIYYNGKAESVSAENDTGPFDILPRHHNFMTLLRPCDVVVRSGGQEQKFRISRGIMHVKKNQVVVFLDV